MPAQFTRISTLPNCAQTASKSACRLERLATSQGIASEPRPAALICAATDSTSSRRRPEGTTLAPAVARPLASVRPMPDVPPITTAVLEVRSSAGCPIEFLLLVCQTKPCLEFYPQRQLS